MALKAHRLGVPKRVAQYIHCAYKEAHATIRTHQSEANARITRGFKQGGRFSTTAAKITLMELNTGIRSIFPGVYAGPCFPEYVLPRPPSLPIVTIGVNVSTGSVEAHCCEQVPCGLRQFPPQRIVVAAVTASLVQQRTILVRPKSCSTIIRRSGVRLTAKPNDNE